LLNLLKRSPESKISADREFSPHAQIENVV
jgi:hypothetical protein